MPDPLRRHSPRHYALAVVATELHPFTRGGIGVLYGNLLQAYGSDAGPILFVNAGGTAHDQAVFARHFPDHDLINAHAFLSGRTILSREAFADTADWHYTSYVALQALLRLRRDGASWDWLEFQDFGGLGAATLSARPVEPLLHEGGIALRVHGPEAVLRRHSPRASWSQHIAVMDLERVSYQLADLVVGHTPGVLDELQSALCLDLSDRWSVEHPPVGQCNDMGLPDRPGRPRSRAVFASKLESIKAPDVFFKAVAHLPPRAGAQPTAVVLADRLQSDDAATARYVSSIEKAGDALEWFPAASAEERKRWLASSCVVIPGPFEAFCLLAYETALLGGRPVLSSANPAFGAGSVWVDGENCWTFDGSPRDLARVLSERLDEPLTKPLVWEHEPDPYWRRAVASAGAAPGPADRGSAGVVVVTRDLDESVVADCLQSLVDQSCPPDELVVVDDGSDVPWELGPWEARLRALGTRVTVVRHRAPLGLGAAWNAGRSVLGTDYVCFMEADGMLDSRFLQRARAGLDSSPRVGVIAPYTASFTEPSEVFVDLRRHVLPFIGATHFGRYISNALSSATNLVRMTVLEGALFDEHLPLFQDWDLWCQLAEAGVVFAVDPTIGSWRRQHGRSLSADAFQGVTLTYAMDTVRTNALRRGAGDVPAMVVTDAIGVTTPTILPLAPSDAPTVLDHVEPQEVERLRAVEAEMAQIVDRRAVRLVMGLADLRPRPRRSRGRTG